MTMRFRTRRCDHLPGMRATPLRIAKSDSEFGLGSAVPQLQISTVVVELRRKELEAGMSFVNENVRSDPRAPFGGVKHSGYGRECGAFGIRRVREHQDGPRKMPG